MADEIDWEGVRRAYEAGEEPLRRIRARFGVGVRALRERRIAEGWTPRSAVPAEMARVRLAELKRAREAREGQERANPNTLPRLRTGQKAALTRKKTARLVAALKTGGRRAQKARERLADAAGMGNERPAPGTGEEAGAPHAGGEMGGGRAGRAARAPDKGVEAGAPDTGRAGRVRAASKPAAISAAGPGSGAGKTPAPSAAMRLLALAEAEIERLEALFSMEGRIVDEKDFRMLGEAARMLDRAETLAGKQTRRKGADASEGSAAEGDDVQWMRAELERRIESLAGRARPSGRA